MKRRVTVELNASADLEQCTAALRQLGLEEVGRLDAVADGFSIEHLPDEQGTRLHIQIDEGYADQVTTVLKKCGGRSLDPPSSAGAPGLDESWTIR